MRVSGLQFLNSPPSNGLEKTVVVFGHGRGGTSAISGALRVLGVAMSELAHPMKHEWSPITYVNEKFERSGTQKNLAEMDSKYQIWGWKSPRDVFSVAQFGYLLRNPHYIVVFRNPLAICESTQYHEGTNPEAILPDIAEVITCIAGFVSSTAAPLALVSYEQLLAMPKPILEELSSWLGLTLYESTIKAGMEFVSEARYRSINDDTIIDQMELARDAEESKTRVYLKRSRESLNMISALEKDIAEAQAILRDLEPLAPDQIEQRYLELRRQYSALVKRRQLLQLQLDKHS
jgi:hypothetical protein